MARSQENRSLSADGLARLLARLDPDVERAAVEYKRLHAALVRFFDWRGASAPEDCADEVLDRVARRLQDDVDVESVRSYAHGIARLVLLEQRRMPVVAALDGNTEYENVAGAQTKDEDDTRFCFDRCLDSVPADDRSTAMQYYEGERAAKIQNRRRLAAALGLSENALRIRVRRFRTRLESCVESCLALKREPA
jgi:DNA-directed RNA polymerase specialized sigma24 family protein